MAVLVQPTTSATSAKQTVKSQGTESLFWLDFGIAIVALLLLAGLISTASVEVQAISLAVAAIAASIGATWYLNRRRSR